MSDNGIQDRDDELTVVHVMRHGEVENPTGVLYGRLPGYHLSELGRQKKKGQKQNIEKEK